MIKQLSKIKTYIYFIFFLLIATFFVFIKVSIYGSWLPSLFVLIYGLLLLMIQHSKEKILIDQEKDSPYFMGFMLTLISLLFIFTTNDEIGINNSFQTLFESIGIAISTTIVGLFFRYVIVISDNNETKEKELLNILAEQQEKTILSYINAQDNLYMLISSFSENHQKIIEEEFKYHNEYINKINTFNSGLDEKYILMTKSYEEKAQQINENSSKFSESLSNFYNDLNDNSNNILSIQKTFTKNIENYVEELNSIQLKETIKELTNSIIKTNEEHNNLFKNLKEKIESSSIENSLNQLIASINEINSKTIQTLEEYSNISNTSFDEFNKKMQESFSHFENIFQTLSNDVNNFGSILDNTGNKIDISINSILQKMKDGIINTNNDIKMIDKLLTDFTKTIENNIKKM